ncbi:MAG TPA: D-alanyl-D-alanine dipeptidase [Firmicutes bacterium]|nr:D-alanyl-D-alanine dipeptidase [Candidatus Fermentithermobacillaceae bacterium]
MRKRSSRTDTMVRPFLAVLLVMVLGASLTACELFKPTGGPVDPEEPGDPDGETGELDVGKEPVRIEGLVELTALDDSFVIDLKYATEDNFTGKRIYSEAIAILREETAHKLIKANEEFKKLGYRLKIWDAYRPFSAQQVLWDAVDDKTWVADPTRGSNHNRGAAVDVTLVDSDGNELPMPSGFDDFSERAHQTYDGCTEEEARNRDLLRRIMNECGFVGYVNEWWHFNDSDAKNYPVLDIPFSDFSSGK